MITREPSSKLVLVKADVQVRVELLNHPGKRRVDEVLGVVDPAEVAVRAGEVDLVDVGAAHEGFAVGAAGLVQRETVEGELDIW